MSTCMRSVESFVFGSMTRTPIIRLAITRESASEMSEPAMPQTRQKTMRPPIPVPPRPRPNPSTCTRMVMVSITRMLVIRKRTMRFAQAMGTSVAR